MKIKLINAKNTHTLTHGLEIEFIECHLTEFIARIEIFQQILIAFIFVEKMHLVCLCCLGFWVNFINFQNWYFSLINFGKTFLAWIFSWISENIVYWQNWSQQVKRHTRNTYTPNEWLVIKPLLPNLDDYWASDVSVQW